MAEPGHFIVATDARLRQLDVRVCFREALPRALNAHSADAARLLHSSELESGDSRISLEIEGSSLTLPRSDLPACVHYFVDLASIDDRHWRSGNWRTDGAILLDPDLWLWYPEGTPEYASWRADFVLPPDHDVSAPWQRLDEDPGAVSYEIRRHMSDWQGSIAIGRFRVESIELPGGQLRYALLPGTPAADAKVMRRWVTAGARALINAYGRLPVPETQLLVIPIGHGREPVPWGAVQRGGGDAVHLYVDQRRSAPEFMADWVLVHELSHLLHPAIDSAHRWLPEGLASYYQNVLRARAGLISPQAAWDELDAGFKRGIRGTPKGRSLAEVSETMMRDRSFMRVYWSGAAISLLADVELRRRSSGTQSLDTALAAFGDCCLPSDRSWSAREMLEKLDELTGFDVFMVLYRKYVDSDRFPDLGAIYRELGLRSIGQTGLHLESDAPLRAIREAIMAPPKG